MAGANSPRDSVLENSVERLVLQQELASLISQYSFTWDGKDAPAFAELFTEDCVYEIWRSGGAKATRELKGRAVVRDFAVESFSIRLADRQTRHYQTNTVFIDVTDTVVQARTMVVVLHAHATDKSLKVAFTGTYEDEFRRTLVGWRISKRIIRLDT